MTPRKSHEGQEGIALIAAILVGVILMILAAMVMSVSLRETNQSHRQVRLAAASQAAEAALDDYTAKLTENHDYNRQYVHPAEQPRVATDGTVVQGGLPWTKGDTWTYAAANQPVWRQLPNGFEYSLQVVPPTGAERAVTVRVTGRKSGRTTDTRSYEATIRPATPLDFQRIVERDLSYASDATTDGKVYVGGNLNHPGIYRANVYAEGNVTWSGSPTGALRPQNGAKKYDSTNIRSAIKNPILFSQFAVSLATVKSAAQGGGIYLNDPTVKAWRLRFLASGNVEVSRCTAGTGSLIDYYANGTSATPPQQIPCAAPTSLPMPVNGAIYAEQMALVGGTVNGRVTVVSNQDIVMEAPTNYVDGRDDTLGMIPKNQFKIAWFIRSNMSSGHLDWWGSVLVMNYPNSWGAQVKSGNGPVNVTSMTHHGSATTPHTGNMSVIPNRLYTYDKNLQFLQPPYFPVLEDTYSIQGFRELAPS